METILFRMKENAQQYVEVLRDIVGIDVSILDDRQVRVAGSGRMKERTGSMVSFGNIMRHAMQTQQVTVVMDPVVNPVCEGCPSRDRCDNLAEIWAPIVMDGRAIGVIGCVCYDEEKKRELIARKDLYITFFRQFASLIGSQASVFTDADRRRSVQKLLEHTLSMAQIGVLILDSAGSVYKINSTGRELLSMDDRTGYQDIRIKPAGDGCEKEYIISFDGHAHRVVADTYSIGIEPYDRLMLFGSAQFRTEVSDSLLGLAPVKEIDRIIGRSEPIIRLKREICLVASSTSNVLVTGESGTGKELVARAIHGESLRKDGPFVAVNCAALPENLLESELFGYVRGAFTGASSNGRKGLLETAEKGTFFLDEIGDMPLPIQVKLLRVLEQREITRVGSNVPIPINVRFVFATNRDLEQMVRDKTFREDLFYRINVVPLSLPPLRERKEDIRLIAGSFIRRFSISMQRPCSGVSEDFWRLLESYDWPGNIRELQNMIEYAMNLLPSSGVLRSELLRNRLYRTGNDRLAQNVRSAEEFTEAADEGTNWNLEQMEKRMIRRCLEQNKENRNGKQLAAQSLGISMATLYRKMKQYGL